MKYGQYYIDSMPVGDETGDCYNVVYLGNPNYGKTAREIDNFTITQAQTKTETRLRQAIGDYMQVHHPGAETLIAGCTAMYDKHNRKLIVREFGKVIIDTDVPASDEEDFWVGYDHSGRSLDFSFCYSRDKQIYSMRVYPVIDGHTKTHQYQVIYPAFDLCGEAKRMLRSLGIERLCLVSVDTPSRALWYDNSGDPHETEVIEVGIDDESDLFLKVDDDCGGSVTLWESCDQIRAEDMELVINNIEERMRERICVICGRPVFEGFIVGGGDKYYCSEECLYTHYTAAGWAEMCKGPEDEEEGGSDQNFWTTWWDA